MKKKCLAARVLCHWGCEGRCWGSSVGEAALGKQCMSWETTIERWDLETVMDKNNSFSCINQHCFHFSGFTFSPLNVNELSTSQDPSCSSHRGGINAVETGHYRVKTRFGHQ